MPQGLPFREERPLRHFLIKQKFYVNQTPGRSEDGGRSGKFLPAAPFPPNYRAKASRRFSRSSKSPSSFDILTSPPGRAVYYSVNSTFTTFPTTVMLVAAKSYICGLCAGLVDWGIRVTVVSVR